VVGIVVEYSQLFNVKMQMSDVQINFFAEQFISEYGYESLDDLIYCIKNAAMGKYGELYNSIDPPKMFEWFKLHLEQKAEAREKLQQSKKISITKQLEKNEINQRLNAEWSGKVLDKIHANKPKKKTMDEIKRQQHIDHWNKLKPQLHKMDKEFLQEILQNFKLKNDYDYTEEIQTIKQIINEKD